MGNQPRINMVRRKQIVNDYMRNLPVKEVADKHGVGESTVCKIVNEQGVPKRRLVNRAVYVTDRNST